MLLMLNQKKVAIVGDTANDMKTAINAHLGLAIGVLTGVAKRGTLRRDVIINSAKDVKQVMSNTENKVLN